MKKILFNLLLIVLFAMFLFSSNKAFAFQNEGTKTFKDYLFVLVHGINSSADIFEGKTLYGNLKKYLEDNLDLHGRVFAYTFTDTAGKTAIENGQYKSINKQDARELGDRSYQPTPNFISWLERAREDFQDFSKYPENKNKNVPTKYILISHSMGNFAVRSYIYSDSVFGNANGFYQNDVEKVVFIAPPLLGSDSTIAMAGFWARAARKGYQGLFNGAKGNIRKGSNGEFEITDFHYEWDWDEIISILMNREYNPFHAYYAAVLIAGVDIYSDQVIKNGFGYNSLKPWLSGLIDMWPNSPIVETLRTAKLNDVTKEPAYSIVYGKGIPVFDWESTLAMTGIKCINDKIANYEDYAEQCASRGYDYFSKGDVYDNLFMKGIQLNYGILSLPLLGNLSTSQARLLSFTQASLINFGFFINDGDALVPEYSARGDTVEHLRKANRYTHTFKTDRFENYLSNQLPMEITATETAIAATAAIMAMSGTPYNVAWQSLWPMRIPVSVGIVVQVHSNIDDIRWDLEAHGRMVGQYDLIRTAILDTPAIFTVQDIQTTKEEEATASSSSASGEVTALSITTPRTPPSGYQSLKIKSINEKRVYYGNQNMAIPITIDGDRKYITEILVTKPPKRIEGKLNYLIPKLMKQFQYSFNHAAWKNIKNVHPVTGEFVLENLPFAEGQNTLAIRATNAVGVKSHQLCKFVLNTIPMLISNMTPKPNTYTNNPQPIVGGSFIKSVYTENTTIGEGIPAITSAKLYLNDELLTDLLSDPNFTQQNVKVNDYRTEVNFSYNPPEPLKDGQYKIVVEAKSEVGASRGEWPFWVDTTPPEITFEIKMVPK
ncbi:hypothetical protein ACFL52_00755 [Candidatus Margulisiibacteriota bacterium]